MDLQGAEAGNDAAIRALQKRVAALEAALAEETAAGDDAAGREDDAFIIGGLDLQLRNPELTITGDLLGSFNYHETTQERWDHTFRGVGLHFGSSLGSHTRFKVAVPVSEDGVELEEAYMTRYDVLDGVNLSAGKFRQQFGSVNRLHKHALNQVDFPLPLLRIFGEEGLNQAGLSVSWQLPDCGYGHQSLIMQLTDGENDRLFAGNHLSTPTGLLRYACCSNLGGEVHLDLGATALVGWNDRWDLAAGGTRKKSLSSRVYGMDVCVLWEPDGHMGPRNIEWRTEGYLLRRVLMAPDGTGRDTITAWGAYTYVQGRLNSAWTVGTRLDWFQPDDKSYAGTVASVSPFVVSAADRHEWQVCPYVTWHQNPYMKLRLEYDHLNGKGTGSPQHAVMLQVIFEVGSRNHAHH